MDRQYKHLDYEERGVIFAEHRRGSSLRQIGRLLGRHASTITLYFRMPRLFGELVPRAAMAASSASSARSCVPMS